ncbi:MAG: peptide-methionine (S)-S-oxide reductase MsrA [Polyangiaceae bacterium]|nr:peptide-methionine (S)-S-oxide reductase MsrA [Polyangiaceae bacterium]
MTSEAKNPAPEQEEVFFALGCFWGAERKFWSLPGVLETAVGYTAGQLSEPSYEAVCSGETGHTEAVKVVYDPRKISLEDLFQVFWEAHDPTQGNRQGNDRGTQYRSGIYLGSAEQLLQAKSSRNRYQEPLSTAGYGPITTEIAMKTEFWPAEQYHQKYLMKNPNGYCGLGGTGVLYPAEKEVSPPR